MVDIQVAGAVYTPCKDFLELSKMFALGVTAFAGILRPQRQGANKST